MKQLHFQLTIDFTAHKIQTNLEIFDAAFEYLKSRGWESRPGNGRFFRIPERNILSFVVTKGDLWFRLGTNREGDGMEYYIAKVEDHEALDGSKGKRHCEVGIGEITGIDTIKWMGL